MLELDCIFQLGFHGAEYTAGSLQLTTANVGGVAGLYSTHHILKMGQYFIKYVENPVDGYFIETQEIYSPSPLPLLRTTKQHAPFRDWESCSLIGHLKFFTTFGTPDNSPRKRSVVRQCVLAVRAFDVH